MRKQATREDTVVKKIRRLLTENAAEVEDFVDFLVQREDRRLTRAAAKMSETVFQKVWGIPTMPSTTGYRFGDALLVPSRFTDQTGAKQRPAVVVSSQAHNARRGN